jgi:hypothetical protein
LAPPFVGQRSPKWQLCRGPLFTKFPELNLRVFFLLFNRTPSSQPTIFTCSCYNYSRFCHSFIYCPHVNQHCLISVHMNTSRIYVSPFYSATLNICKTHASWPRSLNASRFPTYPLRLRQHLHTRARGFLGIIYTGFARGLYSSREKAQEDAGGTEMTLNPVEIAVKYFSIR